MFFFKKLWNKLVSVVGGVALPPIELLANRTDGHSLPHPPIFFLGAPRSGTTLAMQVITDVFDLGYLSNLHAKYYGAPCLVEKFFFSSINRPRSTYHSLHGVTDAIYAPSEASQWWYRFFRRNPRYVDLSGADTKKMLRFRKSVQSMILACGKPVLYKNPHAALRIQPIAKFLPESLFIIIDRDEIDNAHSLLEVRNKVYQDYSRWWSMEPPNIDEIRNLPAEEQVIQQIRCIHSTIKKDLEIGGVEAERCFTLKYENLCKNPEKEMKRLEYFFSGKGISLSRRCSAPEPFASRKDIRIEKELYSKLVSYVNES